MGWGRRTVVVGVCVTQVPYTSAQYIDRTRKMKKKVMGAVGSARQQGSSATDVERTTQADGRAREREEEQAEPTHSSTPPVNKRKGWEGGGWDQKKVCVGGRWVSLLRCHCPPWAIDG